MNNYLVEFLGTFVFLYIILQSGLYGNMQPLVIVVGLLAAILLFGNISGGHFNPAVTVMMWLKGVQPVAANDVAVGYVVAQVLGGAVALYAHKYITNTPTL